MHANWRLVAVLATLLTASVGRAWAEGEKPGSYPEWVPVLPALQFLSVPEVEEELQLSPGQRDEIVELRAAYRLKIPAVVALRDAARVARTDEERRAAQEKFRAATEAVEADFHLLIWKLLNETQRERPLQLIRRYDMGEALLFDPAVKQRVRLAAAQWNSIQAAVRQFRKARDGARGPDLERLQAQAAADRDRQILGLLSDDQKAAWTELIGVPFDFQALRTAAR